MKDSNQAPSAADSDAKFATQENVIKTIDLYESEDKVYVRRVKGFYQRIRRFTGIPLALIFLTLPWLQIDGRASVFFDLPQRQFYVLWVTFGPQDGMLLGWLLIIAAFALFTVTALFGRIWCGFTCPQTVWTLIFIWVEHYCEGDRNKRIKLDNDPWSGEKILRKGIKYLVWLLISFVTGATFVGYFHPIDELLIGFLPTLLDSGLVVLQGNSSVIFWTLFFTGMTLMNAGFLREQVCKYMCPYARFQSVMYDNDTLAVSYNAQRGESRGPRKNTQDYKATGLGDCIDCSWCVQVCPVDIDIRDGMQSECINCGLCVDACNSVMDKMNYPKGLISFTSEEQIQTGTINFIRPRVVGYFAMLAVMTIVFIYTVSNRAPVTVDVSRDRGAHLYKEQGDNVENIYMLKVHNMDRYSHEFNLAVEGPHRFKIKRYRAVPIEVNEIFSFPVRVTINKSELKNTKTSVTFVITSKSDAKVFAQEKSVFIAPSKPND
jgi:cytochrome c oxidase accessory protein FixG